MEGIRGPVLAVGGGKGGVGKSVVAANLSCAIAMGGYKVILVDADLAGANIHTLFGIKHSRRTLNDYLLRKVNSFEDVLLPTPVDTLFLVCGATEFLELANPKYPQKQRLLRGIAGLRADYIVIDIGAGAPPGKTVIEGIVPVPPAAVALQRDAVRILEAAGAAGEVSVRRDPRGVVLSLGEQALFDAGLAAVKASAAGPLAAVAAILRKAQCDAVVEGHTDSLPIANSRFASNWDLSAARATGVLARLIEDHEILPPRLAAAGYAEFRPVATNATPEGRARNRRVDVVLLLPAEAGGSR